MIVIIKYKTVIYLELMKKYLLFAEQLYSYTILRPLQDVIRKRGDCVVWYIHKIPNLLNSEDASVLTSIKDVQDFNADAVFVPTNWVPDFFPGIKVEIFHGFNVNKRVKKGHFRIRGYFDLYCTQGPSTTEPFQLLAKEHGYFRVVETGWSKLDPMFNCKEPNQLRDQLNTDKPIIFYASTFNKAHSSSPILIDHIKKLVKSEKWYWLVTLHPKTDPDVVSAYRSIKAKNYMFIEPGEEVIPMLTAADAMLCDTSSIFIEFLLLNKPVVTFNTSIPAPHLLDVQVVDQIEPALEHALSRPDDLIKEIKHYCSDIHPSTDGHAAERIVQATNKFISSNKSDLKSKPWNLGRKLKIRKKLKYYKL